MQCEWALDVKRIPQEVVMECLAIREQRSGIDLVADVTESQLKKVQMCGNVIPVYCVILFREHHHWTMHNVMYFIPHSF